MMTTPSNAKHLAIGRYAELNALLFLESRGLKLIKKNFNSKIGEIDLIMQDGDYVVFIEVRHRTNPAYGDPVESITHHKRQKIIRTAKLFLQIKKWVYTRPCRFDIIAFQPDSGDMGLEWIKNAFSLDG